MAGNVNKLVTAPESQLFVLQDGNKHWTYLGSSMKFLQDGLVLILARNLEVNTAIRHKNRCSHSTLDNLIFDRMDEEIVGMTQEEFLYWVNNKKPRTGLMQAKKERTARLLR
jgi:hypothetical protein